MSAIFGLLSGVLILVGGVFILVAAIGLLRFPDLYTRMHAASKAGTLGAGVLLLALAIESADIAVIMRATAGIVFLLLTAPLAAHLLARAAYIVGVKPWDATKPDELSGKIMD